MSCQISIAIHMDKFIGILDTYYTAYVSSISLYISMSYTYILRGGDLPYFWRHKFPSYCGKLDMTHRDEKSLKQCSTLCARVRARTPVFGLKCHSKIVQCLDWGVMKRLCWKTAQKCVLGMSNSKLEKKNWEGGPPPPPPLTFKICKKGKKWKTSIFSKI